jgi:hypothetical protein
MNPGLLDWIGGADLARYSDNFEISQPALAAAVARPEEYYISLVSAIFSSLKSRETAPQEWAALGNALGAFAQGIASTNKSLGIEAGEAALFAALAFYAGGFPASAALTLRGFASITVTEEQAACIDLLTKRSDPRSDRVRALANSIRIGDEGAMAAAMRAAMEDLDEAFVRGPTDWIFARTYKELLERFGERNLRAVLPNGYSRFWDLLVRSFAETAPPVWEFFPSQIDAIRKGILDSPQSYSLQMPTGAGKTALCETLIYRHAKAAPGSVAVLLVPFRAIASELKATMVRRLNSMGIVSRSEYGGTVPTAGETAALEQTQAVIATPEALSGILNAAPTFLERISLVICDEGHLLAAPERGVALELLLTRLMLRLSRARFVFLSAIVPNLEEINAWLGGSDDTVVRSDYRPTSLDFAVLRPSKSGHALSIGLELHRQGVEAVLLPSFLSSRDFAYVSRETRRGRTYPFRSAKTQAVAAARKALPMGPVALFARNKRGPQGAIGLAQELLEQLRCGIDLPRPDGFDDGRVAHEAATYLEMEFGRDWVGTQIVRHGAILHHGDIPQETREVLEFVLRQRGARLAVCTSTLAEGVNLPFRTLILYSLRQYNAGRNEWEAMLSRDIKNLVGRAGRAGASTDGLVVCANPQDWAMLNRVAQQAKGEDIVSALSVLIARLRGRLALSQRSITNEDIEVIPALFPLVDGVDSALVDLAAEEIGEEELIGIAQGLAARTFAATTQDAASGEFLQSLFQLRAQRIASIRTAGRLGWLRETGARARMIRVVEQGLSSAKFTWEDVVEPTDRRFVDTILSWAWSQRELADAVVKMKLVPEDSARNMFFTVVRNWLAGEAHEAIAKNARLTIDDVLLVLAQGVKYDLQTIVEQGIALLAKFLESEGREFSAAVAAFPMHLRYGVPSAPARGLCDLGFRHRSAAVKLGGATEMLDVAVDDPTALLGRAIQLLNAESSNWERELGSLVYRNTLRDIDSAIGPRR